MRSGLRAMEADVDREEHFRRGYVKVELSEDEHTEWLWALPVDGSTNRFALQNVPYFAYRVSEGDVVEAELLNPGFYRFLKVVDPSGNRTVRVAFVDDEDPAIRAELLQGLVDRGCSWEGATASYVSVTIPPAVDLANVADDLTVQQATWEYANPKYEDLFPPSQDPEPIVSRGWRRLTRMFKPESERH
jgi:hypothetical protein